MSGFEDAAKIIVRRCLAIQRNESVLVITDDPLHDLGYLLYRAVCRTKAHCMMLEIQPMGDHGDEPHPAVAEMMYQVDVIIIITSKSLSHTRARQMACKSGARVISMPGITRATFQRIAATNFDELAVCTLKLADILTIGHHVRVTSPNGTDLTMSIENRQGYADIGLATRPGSFSNLPAGEASLAPVEGTTTGVLVVDSGFGIQGRHEDQIVIQVKNGRAVRISGDNCAAQLRRQLKKYGPDARNIAEFGIGTNKSAVLTGYSLEDEKVHGTSHIALGNNISFGGNISVPLHLDGVIYDTSVIIDRKKIVEHGNLIF